MSRHTSDPQALTSREKEVLRLILTGMRSKQIAIALGISFKTVVTHRTHIMSKLDCHNLAELVRTAMQKNLASDPAPQEAGLVGNLREAQRKYMEAARAYNKFLQERPDIGLTHPDSVDGARKLRREEHFAFEKYSTLLKELSEVVTRKS